MSAFCCNVFLGPTAFGLAIDKFTDLMGKNVFLEFYEEVVLFIKSLQFKKQAEE